jgi:hypothetical protein
MPSKDGFPAIFGQLRAILKKHEKNCIVHQDTDADYYLNTKKLDKNKKPLFFGATSIKKGYVSLYLMPVYYFPDLLDEISPELKAHMQGKSCFNFKTIEPALFKELAALAKKGAERFEQKM